MSAHGMLLTALPSKNQAVKIAKLLVEERMAACVQLLPIESFYRWQGKTENAAETLLLIKTRTALFEDAIARIKQAHPYTVPEIVGTDFIAGFQGYFGWIDEVTGEKPAAPKPPVKKGAPKTKPRHPHNDGQISAKKSAAMRTGISRPMRVK